MNKFKEHFNDNQYIYWVFSILISLGIINWLMNFFSSMFDIIGIAIYNELYIRSESITLLLIFSLFSLLIFLINFAKSKINIFYGALIGLLISININILISKNVIESKISIVTPYINNEELQDINKRYFLIEGKTDYLELLSDIEDKIAKKIN